MAQSPHIEEILNLASALYRRGAVPEALAIAREVFVSLLDRDDLIELVPAWIRSLKPAEKEPPPVSGVVKAIESLERSLDPAECVRAVTNLCVMQPSGAAVAERALRGVRVWGYRPDTRWRRLPGALWTRAIGWEIASPVLTAARHHRVSIPEDFTRQIEMYLPPRDREPLSPGDIDLVNAYARGLHEQGQEQPGIRLAVACAVSSIEPIPMTEVIEIVGPDRQVQQTAELFDRRGYPTEAANVLLDSIQELPIDAAKWQQLLDRVEQSLAEYSNRREAVGGERSEPPASEPLLVPSPAVPDVELPSAAAPGGAPPDPPPDKPDTSPAPPSGRPPDPPSEPDPLPDKSFFFLLKGDQAYKDQVVRGQPADLHFLYDVPSIEALARLEGRTLDDVVHRAHEGQLLEIGVFIKPVGFTFRGPGEDYQIARIVDDTLRNKVRFRLQARDRPDDRTGFHAVLTYNGAEVFQAFIPITIVDALDRTSTTVTHLAVSKSTFDLNEALPRDLTAFIVSDEEGRCRVSMRVGRKLYWSPNVLNVGTLNTAILGARNALAKVADSPAFRTLKPGRWSAAPEHEPEFLGALCRTMSAGSTLYKFLHDSPATQKLVEAIDGLKTGSKISIFTDSAFVPWEILFQPYFFTDKLRVTPGEEPEGFQPELLWGNRFEFETVLVFTDRSDNIEHTLPMARRQPGTMNIRIGVGSTVEPEPEPGTPPEERELNAVTRHRDYCDRNPSVAHWLNGRAELEKALTDQNYDVSLLYLMCHGKNNGVDAELDFGGYTTVPQWLNPERVYPGWPIVFINSCSIAALSPYLFDSFLRRFREKNAFGLIASSFPVPPRFATLFGCAFLEGYADGTRVGELLLHLRQQLLASRNPLALFYALQCPLDVQRPERP